ncbi:hypothetical protein EMIT0158MI4_240015 [Burkholderia ambifaria]
MGAGGAMPPAGASSRAGVRLRLQPRTELRDERIVGRRARRDPPIAARRDARPVERHHQAPAREFIIDQRQRAERDAQPVDGRLQREVEVVERLPLAPLRRHAGRREPVAPAFRPRIRMQQHVPGEIVRAGNRRALEQRGAADRNHAFVEEVAARAVRPVAGAAADRDVEAIERVERRVRRGQLQLDVRHVALEPRQARQQPFHREGRQRIDAQHARGTGVAQLLGGERDAVERGAHGVQITAAFVGEPHALAVAVEHRLAEPRLEPGDLPADGTVSHMQLVAGGAEAFVSGRCFKGPKRGKGREIACHACDSRSQGRVDKIVLPAFRTAVISGHV